MTSSITVSAVFQSQHGKIGKTILSANIAALLANMGYKVALLDFDYAKPTFHNYFRDYIIQTSPEVLRKDIYTEGNSDLTRTRDGTDKKPRWINDLFYIKQNIERIEKEEIHLYLKKAMIDLSPFIRTPYCDSSCDSNLHSSQNITPISITNQVKLSDPNLDCQEGELWLGVCNPNLSQIQKFVAYLKDQGGKRLKRFIRMMQVFQKDFGFDFILYKVGIDNISGFRIVANIIFELMRKNKEDISRYMEMVTCNEFLLLPYFPKYIVYNMVDKQSTSSSPHLNASELPVESTNPVGKDHRINFRPLNGHSYKSLLEPEDYGQYNDPIYAEFPNIKEKLNVINMHVASEIPWFDDFSLGNEFLTALRNPKHPFSDHIRKLADILIRNHKVFLSKNDFIHEASEDDVIFK